MKFETEVILKKKKDRAKVAVSLAMQSRWSDAMEVNLSILSDSPDDLEANNRLGKALSELGRNGEARKAFQQALKISPHNSIARKNLDRLARLGDDAPGAGASGGATPRDFIEESGKAGVTSLINLAPADLLLKMAPGHPVQLDMDNGGLRVTSPSGEYLGLVEPKLASRLVRLVKGGNRYEAMVRGVADRHLTVIIREVYRDPSRGATVSFPSKGGADTRVSLPGTVGSDLSEEEAEPGQVAVKDWSDDDTEPGDDDAFKPVVHRIIGPGGEDQAVESDP